MKLAIKRSDGGVSIMTFTDKNPDIEANIKKWESSVASRGLTAVSYRIVTEQDIPESREFRDAWEDSQEGEQIDISCTKAKDIQLTKLRTKRNSLLDLKDKEYVRALEQDLDTQPIKEEKQMLRDITEKLKNLDTADKYNDGSLIQQIRDLGTL